MRRLAKLLGLPRHERVALLEAWTLLLLVALALRLVAFSRIVALARAPWRTRRPAPLSVARLLWLVEVAGRYAPCTAACLEQALVLSWLLGRRGVATTLRIGVARRDGGLAAHAWLEHEGTVILGRAESGDYAPLLAIAGTGGQ